MAPRSASSDYLLDPEDTCGLARPDRPLPWFGVLRLDVHDDGGWEVARPFHFQYEPGRVETIAHGFRTDLASVPRLARPVVRTWGRWSKPSVVHDHYYRTGKLSRREADRRFLSGMEATGVNWLARKSMYAAVRAFGWIAWRKHS